VIYSGGIRHTATERARAAIGSTVAHKSLV
jgi:hypothetical protein